MESLPRKAFGVLSQAVSGLTQDAIKEMGARGYNSHQDATYVCIGAVTGTLAVLAAIVGEGGDKAAQCTTNGSMAFAALLALACCKVNKAAASSDDHVAIDVQFTAEAVMEATESFKKLFGHEPDGFVNARMLRSAREAVAEGTATANSLLDAICANHKPA